MSSPPVTVSAALLGSSSRYRHPGGVIRLISGTVLLGCSLAVSSPPPPHPGGVGAIEALLTAGLTGIGISPGAAVSAVLIYRLATYWLPVLPGWLCLRQLQRIDYV